MPDESTILAWGCVFLGAWLAGYALYSIQQGRTRGYYQDHEYRAGDSSAGFNRWVWFRLVMGLGCLIVGIIAL